jgi:Plasmid pRiA4b ORF-3-like protein
VLFGWGGDHLHDFEVGPRRYSDPFYPMDGAGDEYAARLRAVLSPAVKQIRYTYDFGAYWQHTIVFEKLVHRTPGQAYPCCVAFSGDSPEEYPQEEEQESPMQGDHFDLETINRRLAPAATP